MRRPARGFTLIELALVTVIVMILSMAVLPNVIGSLKHQPIISACNAAIDLFTFARIRAASGEKAYGVAYDATGSGVLGVYRGEGPSCKSVAFDGVPLKEIDFAGDDYFGAGEGHGPDVRITGVSPEDVTQVCFTPDGRMLDADTQQFVTPTGGSGYGAGDFVLTLSEHTDNAPVGLTHHVIVPYSGRPRFTFDLGSETNLGEGGT